MALHQALAHLVRTVCQTGGDADAALAHRGGLLARSAAQLGQSRPGGTARGWSAHGRHPLVRSYLLKGLLAIIVGAWQIWDLIFYLHLLGLVQHLGKLMNPAIHLLEWLPGTLCCQQPFG